MRSLANFSTGFPNMRGHVTNHAATMAELLRDEGYATFAVGKWHLCQMEDASAAGPYEQWPLARGFDRFYGFLDGETDQFHPELVYDNHAVDQPAGADQRGRVGDGLGRGGTDIAGAHASRPRAMNSPLRKSALP